MIRRIENTSRFLSFTLATLVISLVIAQAIRPILSTYLSDSPIAATVHQRLTRHCVEEVGEEVEVVAVEIVSSGVDGIDSKPARLNRTVEADSQNWLSPSFHRKLPPPSPKDG